jgi:hypothetical protein
MMVETKETTEWIEYEFNLTRDSQLSNGKEEL